MYGLRYRRDADKVNNFILREKVINLGYKYMKEYWKKNPEKYKKNQERLRQIYKEKKFKVFEHYSKGKPKCACSGMDIFLFLELDHINGGGNQERKQNPNRSATSFYSYLIKEGFPEGYQILCSNCNRGKDIANRGRKSVKRFCPVHHPELYSAQKL